ncbi:IclR family transcriptional regulator [Haloarcula marina]|uniref:IclR family transcriptional regulator n=1 Tax=Haloarcula marina TaxID=2961574 RepID=UPI0020B7FD17|nr:IclR family transcriptional regulator [Halomicroarcula marina]
MDVIQQLRELDGATTSEIAEQLGLPQSTAYDHLRTLEELELVVNKDGIYNVGMKFLDFGGYARKEKKIFEVAKPELQDLANNTGENANLMIEEHGRGVFLFPVEGKDAVKLDTHDGYRVHLQTTALGKAMMAHMDEDRVRDILDQHGMPAITDKTISDEGELFEQFEKIREQGYAVDLEERVRGMRCVAAPIRDDENQPLAAVSISGPKSRMQGKRFDDEIPKKVIRTANVVEVNMNYS